MDIKFKKKNILYFANPLDIHDKKWITWFSAKPQKYNCYLICRTHQFAEFSKNDTIEKYKERHNILIIGSVDDFSVLNFVTTIKSIRAIKKSIVTYDIDILHSLYACPNSLWAIIARKFFKRKFIITTRGSDVLIDIPKFKSRRSVYSKFIFVLFKIAFKRAEHITSTSITQMDTIQRLFGIKSTHFIKTGIDPEAISSLDSYSNLPDSLKHKQLIFCPRYLKPIYNNELIVAAIELLPSALKSNYVFVFIAGNDNYNDYSKMLRIKIEKLGVQYEIFDSLTQFQVWAVFKNASLSIMTPNSDGTPNSALEAMAARCPFILGNLDYDAQLFGDTCFRLKSNSELELSNCIQKALLNYPSQMIELAFDKVSKFGNRNIEMKKIEILYS